MTFFKAKCNIFKLNEYRKKKYKILIVDDSPYNLFVLNELLQ